MKLQKIMISTIVGLLSLSSSAFAGDYLPPERLLCKLNEMGKLACIDFNRELLSEDTYTVDFPTGKEVLLNFSTAVAYFTPQNEWSVYYTYKDVYAKSVKLKTTNTSIKPLLSSGNWVKFKEEFYTCKSGYMNCGITF